MRRYKLTDAIPEEKRSKTQTPGRRDRVFGAAPREETIHQANTQVNAGVKSNKDRLVDLGRGEQAAGRQGGG